MSEKFVKYPHHLKYESQDLKHVKLGFTTREGGYSSYPESSFNMARYVDDNPENITKHQEMLADAIGFVRAQWVFPIQTHENRVMEISQSHRGTNIDTLTDDMYGIDGFIHMNLIRY